MENLRDFAVALCKKWWALMSCAAFTFLSLWAAVGNKSNNWVVGGMVLLAVGFFLVAAYGAWNDERQKTVEQRSLYEAERTKNLDPDFTLALGQLNQVYDAAYNLTNILIQCTLTNNGATSHAVGWSAFVRKPDGQETVQSVHFAGDVFNWDLGNGKVLPLHKDKMLTAMTINAVESGHSVSGRLLFQFAGDIRNLLRYNAATLHIGCWDRKNRAVWQQFGPAYPSDDTIIFPHETILDVADFQVPKLPE